MTHADEKSLHDLVRQLESAWNAGDSVAWSHLFTEDADFIHVLGGHFTGRETIERGHRAIFDTIYKGSSNKFTVEKIRFIGSEVAIVFIYAELKITQPGPPPLLQARPTFIAQRSGHGWKIVAFQNTIVTPQDAPAGNAALAKGITSALAEHHPIKGTPKASGE